jgi:hypothetical protein
MSDPNDAGGTARFPARLHVLLARDAARAVVLRRGPTRLVASFLWDRDTDAFTLGQWLGARVYERRSDLSPDGRHLIYFARNARWSDPTGGAWTAVSRAPWLRATALWAKGDCWQGGGLFLDDRRYWLNGCHRMLESDTRLAPDAPPPAGGLGGECLSVYYPRLLRDGWTLAAPIRTGDWIDRFEKPLRHGWTLVKLAHRSAIHPPGTGCYWDEHILHHAGSGRLLAQPGWQWAERDPAGVVYAEDGRLFRMAIATGDGPKPPRLLRDFNGDGFEARAAPY